MELHSGRKSARFFAMFRKRWLLEVGVFEDDDLAYVYGLVYGKFRVFCIGNDNGR